MTNFSSYAFYNAGEIKHVKTKNFQIILTFF